MGPDEQNVVLFETHQEQAAIANTPKKENPWGSLLDQRASLPLAAKIDTMSVKIRLRASLFVLKWSKLGSPEKGRIPGLLASTRRGDGDI